MEELQQSLRVLFGAKMVTCMPLIENNEITGILFTATYDGGTYVALKLSIFDDDLKVDFHHTQHTTLAIVLERLVIFNRILTERRQQILEKISQHIGQQIQQ